MIAGVLIRQHADAAARAQQLDHRLKSVVAIKQFQASLAPRAAHMFINETIPESLIDTRVPHETDKLRHQLRE